MTTDDNNNIIIVQLELTEGLKNENIIEQFTFNPESNEGTLKLNGGVHDEVPVINFPITIDDYNHDEIKKQDIEYLQNELDSHNLESWDITSIIEVLYLESNIQRIIESKREYYRERIEEEGNGNSNRGEREKKRKQHDRLHKKTNYSDGIIDLELSKDLETAGIVEDFIFETDTKNFVLDLESGSADDPDHIIVYNDVRVIWHYNKNWDIVKSRCNKECKKKEIPDSHISLIEQTLDLNYDTILLALKEREKAEEQSSKSSTSSDTAEDGKDRKAKEKAKRRITTFKYSQMGTGELYESVFIAGFPAFIYYDITKKEFQAVKEIEEATRILVPPAIEECPHLRYEFESLEDLNDNYSKKIDDNKKIDLDYFYFKGLKIVSKYNNQSDYKLRKVAIDIVSSYFQDRFATTSYIFPVGGNGSGKSSLAETFRALAYRAVVMTDPTAPNLFRLLGIIEPAQCVIILEEADKIDKSPELMAVLKTGYSYYGTVPKINPYTLKQETFFTYCPKVIVSERSLNHSIARGVNSRTFPLNCFKGIAEHDIKEVLNPTNTGGPDNKELLQEIMDFRKLLLVYRLKHFKDPIPDLDINIEGRDKELVKYSIQLFYGCKCLKQVTATLQTFLDIKNEKKDSTIESILLSIIHNQVVKNKITQIASSAVWEELTKEIPGTQAKDKPNEYHSYDYGTLYSNTISGIICDTFGAKVKHGNSKNYLIFDRETIERVAKEDDTKIVVKGIKKKTEKVKGVKAPSQGVPDFFTLLDNDQENNNNENVSVKDGEPPPSNAFTAFTSSDPEVEEQEEEDQDEEEEEAEL